MGVYIAQSVASTIDAMGATNMLQVVMDNAKNCRAVDAQIQRIYPHINATGCNTHSLNLVLQDWYKSEDTTWFRGPIDDGRAKWQNLYSKDNESLISIDHT